MFKSVDALKALVVAIVVMAINVAISYVVIAVYAYVINPGHEDAYYEAQVPVIAPWSSVVAGVFLFFGAAYLFAKRRPERNALWFAVAIWVGYLLVEFAILAGVGASLIEMFPILALSLGTKLAAAILGAKAATRKVASP